MSFASLIEAEPGVAAGPRRAVMLHTAWRSRGTWLWSQFRAETDRCGFYEPLHEELAALDARAIRRWRPDRWQSGHSATGGYFEEYRPLLGPRGRGVALYRPRFAFEAFFLRPDDPDPELAAYIARLLAAPLEAGRTASLKFCRSLGRVAWFERHFPDAVHLLLLRDPAAMWRSSERALLDEGNRYFVTAPLAILALNARAPIVAAVLDGLGVATPAPRSRDVTRVMASCWRHFLGLDWEARQRAFLAYWVATTVAALDSEAPAFDADRLAHAPEYAEEARYRLQAAAGLWIGPASGALPPPADPARLPATLLRDAARMAGSLAAGLAPDRVALLETWFGEGVASTALPRRLVVKRATPERRPDPLWLRLEDRVVAALRRAVLPLRRLHGRLAPVLGTARGPRMRARLGRPDPLHPERS